MHLYGKPSNIVCNWVIYILCLDLFFPFFLAEKPKVAEKKYFIDTNSIHLPKSNMEMLNPVKDGMSKYWTYMWKKITVWQMINDHQTLYHLPRNTRPQGLQFGIWVLLVPNLQQNPKFCDNFTQWNGNMNTLFYSLPLDPHVLNKHWLVSSVQNYFEAENANMLFFVMKMSQ